jgi:gluconate 2-dehydrogenase alpha chain
MAIRLQPVDVVLVGMGFTGAILARELAEEGLSIVGLERGVGRDTVPDWQSPAMHDELRYSIRNELFQNMAIEPFTFRNHVGEEALPTRNPIGSFLPGTGLGGSAVHWNGESWRFLPSDFVMRSHYTGKYGADAIPEEVNIQDWGVTYEELEPYFDRFEHLCGVGGKAGNLQGEIQPGGNPFEGPRSREYPLPPTEPAYAGALFANAALQLGYTPFQEPSANMTRPYTNPEGLSLHACTICGFCERFGCEQFAKASPQTVILPRVFEQPNFELRTNAHVTRVLLDKSGSGATGVLYVDAQGRETEQPAEIVVLCAYGINNVKLMLNSGIGRAYDPATGEGTVGRNYTYQMDPAVTVFYPEDININPFMGAGALATAIDDFNGDNFDHSGLGFVGGAYIKVATTGGRPIEYHPTPPGTPRWGLRWKQAVRRHYNHTVSLGPHGSSMPVSGNYLSADPTYRDAYGQPLLRFTFDFPENDIRMARFVTDRTVEIARIMGGKIVSPAYVERPYSIVSYQTTHNCGGAVMGSVPTTSAVNRYLQSWDVPNVFVQGASAFPQNPGYNPTGTVVALAYWSAKAIREQYLRSPGPLVQ